MLFIWRDGCEEKINYDEDRGKGNKVDDSFNPIHTSTNTYLHIHTLIHISMYKYFSFQSFHCPSNLIMVYLLLGNWSRNCARGWRFTGANDGYVDDIFNFHPIQPHHLLGSLGLSRALSSFPLLNLSSHQYLYYLHHIDQQGPLKDIISSLGPGIPGIDEASSFLQMLKCVRRQLSSSWMDIFYKNYEFVAQMHFVVSVFFLWRAQLALTMLSVT